MAWKELRKVKDKLAEGHIPGFLTIRLSYDNMERDLTQYVEHVICAHKHQTLRS